MKLSVKQLILGGILSTTLLQMDAQALPFDVVLNSVQSLPLPAKLVVYPVMVTPVLIAVYSVTYGFCGNTYELLTGSTYETSDRFNKSVKFLKFITPGLPNSIRALISIPVVPTIGALIQTYDDFKLCAKKVNKTLGNIGKRLDSDFNVIQQEK